MVYKNTLSVMFNVYRKKDVIRVKLKDGRIRNWRINWVWTYASLDSHMKGIEELNIERENYLDINYKGHIIRFYGVNNNGDILGVFLKEDYRFLKPENFVIIDIGANIGDSSIYLALNNAKKVIALEPYPYSYNYAVKNIDINHLNDKVTLLNAGYANDSEVKVDENKITTGGSALIPSENGKSIKLYSFKSLIKDYNLNNDDLLLKMDCEGCEYNMLNEENETLRKFKRIELEFHYGHKNLESKLKEAGFTVTILDAAKSKGGDSVLKKMAEENGDYTIGLLYAERV